MNVLLAAVALPAAVSSCSADGNSGPAGGAGSGGNATGGGAGNSGTGAGGVAAGPSSGGSSGTATGGGGSAGSGGSSGASGASGAAGSGAAPGGAVGCNGTELLCEDFEDVAEGALPGAPWVAPSESCKYQAAHVSLGVSSAQAHLGSKALKITGSANPECRLPGNFGAVDDFWIRAFIRWDEAVDFTGKELMAVDLVPAESVHKDDPAIRFGSRYKQPCVEAPGPQITITGLAGGEQTGCSANEPPKGQWHCFEAHVTQTSTLSVRTFINGVALKYTSSGIAERESIDTPSAPTVKVDHLRLGMLSIGGAIMDSVYVDDVAVATSRLGCGTEP